MLGWLDWLYMYSIFSIGPPLASWLKVSHWKVGLKDALGLGLGVPNGSQSG